MNILLIASDLGLGGAQQVVINLANELVRQNHYVWIFDVQPEYRIEGMTSRFDSKVNLISKNYGKELFSPSEKLIDFILNKLNIKTENKKKLFRRHEQNLHKILLNEKIDYVNSHVCWADFFVYDNLKNLHNKWIISLHASYNALLNTEFNVEKYTEKAKKTLTTAKKVIYLHNDGILFLEKTLKIKIQKAKKIYNGIPLPLDKFKIRRQNLEIDKDDFVILCASRAHKLKGWYELCEAALRIKKTNLKVIFAGSGPILEEIKIKYERRKNFKFLGFSSNIPELISLADIVCLPSIYNEALPTILIESIFHNKPAIATNVGETASILENKEGKCGILINANKGEKLVKDLVDTINFFTLDNPSFDNGAFEEAKVLFSSKKMAKNYLNYFIEG